ncbi:hypothetical protein DIPPA_16284 [Diplonema papillatum]|nr:hypothetical protein DIPPA_16284 [Diplonema papillatum]
MCYIGLWGDGRTGRTERCRPERWRAGASCARRRLVRPCWRISSKLWFDSFHFKAARKIREKLKRCDVVIEVRGARVPFSSYNTELEKLTLG